LQCEARTVGLPYAFSDVSEELNWHKGTSKEVSGKSQVALWSFVHGYEIKEAVPIRGSSGAAVTAITLTNSLSHICIGDESGQVLWATLWAGA